jgi:hypothetical protein
MYAGESVFVAALGKRGVPRRRRRLRASLIRPAWLWDRPGLNWRRNFPCIPRGSSADVLDPVGQADPRVHAVLPRRDARGGECWVGERACRHRDVLRVEPQVRRSRRSAGRRRTSASFPRRRSARTRSRRPRSAPAHGASVPASRTRSVCAAGWRGSGRSRPSQGRPRPRPQAARTRRTRAASPFRDDTAPDVSQTRMSTGCDMGPPGLEHPC